MSTVTNRPPATYFSRGAWRAVVYERDPREGNFPPSARFVVCLEHPTGYRTQWPVQYDNGAIGYDQDNVPRDGQRATRAAFRWIARYTN